MNASDQVLAEVVKKKKNGSEDPDNLPLGYRFSPTDIDLLLYLTKKITSLLD